MGTLLYQSRYSRKVTNIADGPIHLKYGICQHCVIWHARRRLGALVASSPARALVTRRRNSAYSLRNGTPLLGVHPTRAEPRCASPATPTLFASCARPRGATS